MAVKHLGTRTDIVAAPLMHDTPDEMTTPAGSVSREQEAWIPGVTMPKLVTVERDYTQIGAKFDTLGPLTESLGMVTKGVPFHPDPEVADLAQRHGVATSGPGAGRPLLDTVIKACDTCLLYTSPSPRDGLLSRMPSSA